MKKLRSFLAIVLVVAMLSTLTVVSASAESGVTKAKDFVDAINNSKPGDIIRLGSDIMAMELSDTYLEDKRIHIDNDLTIDLNGCNIMFSEVCAVGFCIENGANVKFTDSTSMPGSIDYDYNGSSYDAIMFTINNNSTLTLEKIKCAQRNFGNIVCCFNGNLIINSGAYVSMKEYPIIQSETSNTGSISINGGTFSSITTDGCNIAMLGGTLNITGGTFTAKNCDWLYTRGGTSTINAGTFNGNRAGINCEGGSVTINGGSFSSSDEFQFYISEIETNTVKTNFVLNKASISATNGAVLSIHGGNVEINDGDFFSTIDYNTVAIDNDYNYTKGNKVTFNGGTFKSTKYQVAYINMSNSNEKMDVIISGGTFKFDNASFNPSGSGISNNRSTIYVQKGNLTINGGTITSNSKYVSGLGIRDSAVTINDANITADSNIAIAYTSGTLNINGGAFEGIAGLWAGAKTADISISAGLFSGTKTIPQEMVPPGLSSKDYEDIYGGIVASSNLDPMKFLVDGYSYYGEDGKDTLFTKSLTVEDTTQTVIRTSKIVAVQPTTPKVIEGANVTVAKDSKEEISIRSNIDFKYFNDGTKQIGEVKVDGITVDPANYTAKSGSTIITFKASFLKTLAPGKHKVQIISNILGNKVIAGTTLTIEGEDIAQTSDTTTIAPFVAVTILSAAAFVTLKKKEQY